MAFTFFFRDRETLEAVMEYVVPRISGRSRIRVWDAGCAKGEEPYTVAIMLAERLRPHARSLVRIDATDIEESEFAQFESVVSKGEYHRTNVEHVPRELAEKYFVAAERPDHYLVRPELRSKVSFQRHDLLSLDPIGRDFSLVVCKNVLLHFKPEQRGKVINMFHKALLPGGFLAMEQRQDLPGEVSGLFENVGNGVKLFRKAEVSP